MCDDKSISANESFWINTHHGQAAVSLLSMFSPAEILRREKVHENKDGNLNHKIKCVLDYIKQNKINASESTFDYLLDFIKKQMYADDEKVFSYGFTSDDYHLIKDNELRISGLINEDLTCKLHQYILAIASYQDCDNNVVATNELIQNLMFMHSDTLNMVHDVLKGCLDRVIDGELPCGDMNGSLLSTLSMDGSKKYTGRELIRHAREYLVNRYVPKVSIIMEKNVPIRIGHVEGLNLVFCAEVEDQVASNLLDTSVTTNGLAKSND
ncbi:MAG: hypothetical protein ACTJLM_04945 [Ehrlichia sp.]